MSENPKLSPKAFAHFLKMQAELQLYLQGVLDGMGLVGNFRIGLNGELIPDSPPETKD